jgi:hypothetical protein
MRERGRQAERRSGNRTSPRVASPQPRDTSPELSSAGEELGPAAKRRVSGGYEPLSVLDVYNTQSRDSSPEFFVLMGKNEISPYHSSYEQMSFPRVDGTQPREANPSPSSSRASIVGEEHTPTIHAVEHAMKEVRIHLDHIGSIANSSIIHRKPQKIHS